MRDIVIKKIVSLLLLVFISSCKTPQLPAVSNKLETVFKEHEKLYKNQKVWKYVKDEYKYDRKVIDSIFTQYNLHNSDDFYIITSTDVLANYSLEIKSIDKDMELKFNDGYKNLNLLPNTVGMSYSGTFEDLGGNNFVDFMKKTPQEELSDCSKKAAMVNSTMILFTYYNKGNIIVKRFQTCDYSEYYNWDIDKEED